MRFKWMFFWKGCEIPTITIIVFAIAAIWSSGMIIAPLTLPPNSVPDLTPDMTRDRWGVGVIDNENITENMNPYAKFYYQAGDSQCHTFKERSLFINGNQMPFCSRDVAIFLGLALGLGITLFIIIPLKWWWLVGGLVPIGLDGALQLVTSYESNNLLRVITGGLVGLVCAFALGFVIHDVSRPMTMKKVVPPEIPMIQQEETMNSDVEDLQKDETFSEQVRK